MACAQYTEAILESVGAAPPPPEVQLHLDACAGCRRLAAQTLRALELIDELPPATVPARFAARMVARAKAETRGSRRALWLSAAAAAAIVVTGGLIAASFTGRTGPAGRGTSPGTPGGGEPQQVAAVDDPPPELLEKLELLENLELIQKLDTLEAVDAVETRERFGEMGG